MQGQTEKFHTESAFLLYGGRMDLALGKKKKNPGMVHETLNKRKACLDQIF